MCVFVTELCVLRTFGGVDFSLIFICAQYVPEFLWDRLRASIQFPVMPKRAQYARFSGETTSTVLYVYHYRTIEYYRIILYGNDTVDTTMNTTLASYGSKYEWKFLLSTTSSSSSNTVYRDPYFYVYCTGQ